MGRYGGEDGDITLGDHVGTGTLQRDGEIGKVK